MHFTPHIPTGLNGVIKDELLERAEKVIVNSAKIVGNFTPLIIDELKEVLRLVNSYYSNLIESQGTHPIDIEKALKKEYSEDEKERKLQKLALRYIEAQKLVEKLVKKGENPFSKEFILNLHRFFYSTDDMSSFLAIEHDGKIYKMNMGEFRDKDVKVGLHIAPSFEEVDFFMSEFERLYRFNKHLPKSSKLIYALSAHHRLTWIHPFLDGNGRISRLILDGSFYYIDLEGYGIWTISRGLARNQEEYKKYLSIADNEKENSYDGRGYLSLKALEKYLFKMMDIMDDQIEYMKGLLQLDSLFQRVDDFVSLTNSSYLQTKYKDKTIIPLPIYSNKVLKEFLIKGELKRGEVKSLIGKSDRTASNLIQDLIKMELIKPLSSSKKSSLKINFPIYYLEVLFPNLLSR